MNLHDSSDVWMRRSTRDKLSLTAGRPREPRAQRIHVDLRDSSDTWKRRSIREKLSLNPIRPRAIFQGAELPHFLRALCGDQQKSAAQPEARGKTSTRSQQRTLKRRVPNKKPKEHRLAEVTVPLPEAQVATGAQTVRFSQLDAPQQPGEAAVHVHMPIPTHFTADGRPVVSAGRSLPVSRAVSSPGDIGRSNRVSMASVEEENPAPQVFQVLGRRNTCRSHRANKSSNAISPVLVTIARDGSIVSDHLSRPSDDRAQSRDAEDSQANRPLATPPLQASPVLLGICTSHGGDSFVTAQTGSVPGPAAGTDGQTGLERRLSDEVSDIAMRSHLHVGDTDSFPAADRTLADWLQAQAIGQPLGKTHHQTIAQAISGGLALRAHLEPAAHTTHGELSGKHLAQQRSHGPAGNAHGPNEHVTGSDQASSDLAGLLSRVSDLESQFTCMEAIMAGIEDRLSGALPPPSKQLSIRRPRKGTPVVQIVGDRSAPAQQDKASADSQSTAQTAAVALADVIDRSRHEFDTATSKALSSMARLVSDIKALGDSPATS
ncbi:hypothetical protein GGF46_001567 [Coemansia sp. RSA 552]|nr:hypothetical protein GGF46_001567 [Coemansia sp. RSA 552]